MIIITTILFISSLIFNLVVARKYNQLHQNNNIYTDSRVSLKILNKAIRSNHEATEIKMIMNCKRYYIIYITLFYISLLFIAVTIYLAVPK